MEKYRNKKTSGFDSKKELRRFKELQLLENAGEITDLKTQVKFELIPAQYIDGKCAERACNYIADFVYNANGVTVVEDVKSPITRTPSYVIKRKLMLQIHGVRVNEI